MQWVEGRLRSCPEAQASVSSWGGARRWSQLGQSCVQCLQRAPALVCGRMARVPLRVLVLVLCSGGAAAAVQSMPYMRRLGLGRLPLRLVCGWGVHVLLAPWVLVLAGWLLLPLLPLLPVTRPPEQSHTRRGRRLWAAIMAARSTTPAHYDMAVPTTHSWPWGQQQGSSTAHAHAQTPPTTHGGPSSHAPALGMQPGQLTNIYHGIVWVTLLAAPVAHARAPMMAVRLEQVPHGTVCQWIRACRQHVTARRGQLTWPCTACRHKPPHSSMCCCHTSHGQHHTLTAHLGFAACLMLHLTMTVPTQ